MKKTKNSGTAVADQTATTNSGSTVEITTKKLGRPVKPDSERQKRLAETEAKKTAMGGYVPLGRAIDPTSKRQQTIAERNAKKAEGYVAQKGRPKMSEEAKAVAAEKRAALKAEWEAKQQLAV